LQLRLRVSAAGESERDYSPHSLPLAALIIRRGFPHAQSQIQINHALSARS
jgi:hypothetical protein